MKSHYVGCAPLTGQGYGRCDQSLHQSGCVIIPAALLAILVGPAILYFAASLGESEQRQPLVRDIAPPEPSTVPKPLRQGEFLAPQSVSALAISPDGRPLAVTTMAFRHDHNFGMGGYGVYQAYRRMVREERTDHGAPYVIFYIWGDDHIRSLLRCRHAIIFRWWNDQGGRAFHNNFWPNIEMDLQTGQFVERENLLPTREALYQMTDPQRMVDLLKDDLALQLFAFRLGLIRDVDRKPISELAARLDFPVDWSQDATLRSQADRLLDRYSLRATRFVLEKAREFARQNGKKLLVVLFDPGRVLPQLVEGRARYDQEIVDFLSENGFTYFDMNVVHVEDFKCFRLTYEQYRQRYFIGHYNPSGNHFFAYSIKNKVVEWLDPKPTTYQKLDPQSVDFTGYLQDFH